VEKLSLVQTLEELKTRGLGFVCCFVFFLTGSKLSVRRGRGNMGGETVFKADKKGFGLFNMFSFSAIRCLMVISDNSR